VTTSSHVIRALRALRPASSGPGSAPAAPARPGAEPGAAAAGTRLVSIDALRGAAALAVVLYHAAGGTVATGLSDATALFTVPFKFGELGVTLFLVISGFCIHLGVASRMAQGGPVRFDWVAFWRRRFHRLYPPYLCAIAVGLLLFAVATRIGTPPQHITSLPWDLAAHLLLVHNLFPHFAFGLGDPPFWSLALEEQLYALYAVYLLLRLRVSVRRTVWVAAGVTVAWVFASAGREEFTVGGFPLALGSWALWPFGFWLYWVLGAVAAEAYAGAITLPSWCYRPRVAVAFACAGAALSRHTLGAVAYGRFVTSLDESGVLGVALKAGTLLSVPAFSVAFFVLVNAATRADARGRLGEWWVRRLAGVGLISYSLYMIHYPVIQVLDLALDLPDSPGAAVVRYLVFVPASLAAGYAFFVLVERRFLNAPAPLALGAPARLTKAET
jgi:peptidoglycan/LPS O-acetylase OafA/YrhL